MAEADPYREPIGTPLTEEAVQKILSTYPTAEDIMAAEEADLELQKRSEVTRALVSKLRTHATVIPWLKGAADHLEALQGRINAEIARHQPTEVYDPRDAEYITICGECQEITGGDVCSTVRRLRGEP